MTHSAARGSVVCAPKRLRGADADSPPWGATSRPDDSMTQYESDFKLNLEVVVTEAVIASYARTPIGRAYRGSLNATHGATLGAHAVSAAVTRAGLDPGKVDDVIVGASLGEGATGANIARQVALRAGFPSRRPA